MKPFDYTAPASLDEATRAGARSATRFIAGGTTLVDLMKLEVETPEHLIDLNPLGDRDPSLGTVSDLPNGGLRIGALARMSDVAWTAPVKERYPVLSQALLLAASGQIRNMASIGGNLMQRPRCLYFRDVTANCNRRTPGTGCSAVGGLNRTHAVLGASDQCVATHPSDLAVALVALDAVLLTRDGAGERRIPLGQFFRRPGTTPDQEHDLRPGELITEVVVPRLDWAANSTYVKVRDRQSYEFALCSAAVALDVRDGAVADARVAVGGVGTVPWRLPGVEAALRGAPVSPAAFEDAAAVATEGATALAHNGYKLPLLRRTVVRALRELTRLEDRS